MGLDINSSLYVLGLKDPLNDKGSIQSEIEEKVISLEHELIPLNDPFLVKLYAAFWIDQTLDAIRLLRSYDESKSQLWFIRKQLTDDIKNDPFELLEYVHSPFYIHQFHNRLQELSRNRDPEQLIKSEQLRRSIRNYLSQLHTQFERVDYSRVQMLLGVELNISLVPQIGFHTQYLKSKIYSSDLQLDKNEIEYNEYLSCTTRQSLFQFYEVSAFYHSLLHDIDFYYDLDELDSVSFYTTRFVQCNNPIPLRKFLKAANDLNIITIDQPTIDEIIFLFSEPRGNIQNFMEDHLPSHEMPTFSVVEDVFYHDLKVLIKKMFERGYITGNKTSTSKLLAKLFPGPKGMSFDSIYESLKKYKKMRFKRVNEYLILGHPNIS